MIEIGDTRFRIYSREHGYPVTLAAESIDAVSKHLSGISPALREGLVVAEMQVVGLRDASSFFRDEEVPTLPDASPAPLRMTGADRALLETDRPVAVEDFAALMAEEETRG